MHIYAASWIQTCCLFFFGHPVESVRRGRLSPNYRYMGSPPIRRHRRDKKRRLMDLFCWSGFVLICCCCCWRPLGKRNKNLSLTQGYPTSTDVNYFSNSFSENSQSTSRVFDVTSAMSIRKLKSSKTLYFTAFSHLQHMDGRSKQDFLATRSN